MNLDQKKQGLNNYVRYTNIAFQMAAIILAGVFGGYKLDQWLHLKPLLTIILSVTSVVLAIYVVTKDLLKKR
jgi:F0F1-type ATP synthase assembly protein I